MASSRGSFQPRGWTTVSYISSIGSWFLLPLVLSGKPKIKKRWQIELYKKGLSDPDNHDGVITHLEPDTPECETLGSATKNKASKGDEIPDELFQILKDDAVSVALNMLANLENSAVATGLEKVSV